MTLHDILIWLALTAFLAVYVLELWKRRLAGKLASLKARQPIQIDGPPLPEREFRAALAVGEDNPLWRAMMQAIAVQQAEAMGEAIDVDTQLRPALLHYYAGASMHLLKLAEFLKAEREKALLAGEEHDD